MIRAKGSQRSKDTHECEDLSVKRFTFVTHALQLYPSGRNHVSTGVQIHDVSPHLRSMDMANKALSIWDQKVAA